MLFRLGVPRPTHVVALDMMCYILVDPGAPICLPSNHLPLHIQPASWILTSCILAQACLCVRLWGLRGEQGEFAQSPPILELGHDPLLYHWDFVKEQNRFIISAIDLWRPLLTFYSHERHLSSKVKYSLCQSLLLSVVYKGLFWDRK